MHLTPSERDRLLLFEAAQLARRRLEAGVLLNVPEATALICDAVLEEARRGGRHEDAVRAGRHALTTDDVLRAVPQVVRQVSVEAVFTDGSRLVVIADPFGHDPAEARHDHSTETDGEAPRVAANGPTIQVVNTAPVTISVTSHFHFFESNPRLRFDRAATYGMHADIPAGTHVRFEPGTPTRVPLRRIGGRRVVIGFAGLVDGPLDAPGAQEAAVAAARACGFLDSAAPEHAAPEHAAARALTHRPDHDLGRDRR